MKRITYFISIVILVASVKISTGQEFIETNSGLWGGDKMIGEHSAIYDIDNDGQLDIIVGHSNASLSHYEQSTGPDFNKFTLISESFNDIDFENYWASPAFADINNDGLVELVVGKSNGDIALFSQISPNCYEFYQITDDWDNIHTNSASSPVFTDLDNDNLLDLIIGTYYGKLYHYEQEEINSFRFLIL